MAGVTMNPHSVPVRNLPPLAQEGTEASPHRDGPTAIQVGEGVSGRGAQCAPSLEPFLPSQPPRELFLHSWGMPHTALCAYYLIQCTRQPGEDGVSLRI